MWNKQAELRETKSETSEPTSKAYFAGRHVKAECFRPVHEVLRHHAPQQLSDVPVQAHQQQVSMRKHESGGANVCILSSSQPQEQ